MTQSGRAGKALKTATIASAYGDYFGEIILIFGAVSIAAFTKQFGPPENFAIYLMAFVVIGSVVSDSIIKGIISTLFGAVIALIGEDTITGQFKMTMGIDELESGMALVPLLIGVFVISEVIIQAEKAAKVKMVDLDRSKLDDPTAHYFTWPEFKRCFPLMFRSSIYGSLIGMMPGLGSSVACFVAYGEEKRRAKNQNEWGTGIVEGIAAPESANNAVSGPSMIPLLTLGIPGSTIAAVLIGMFLVNGLQVGPQIFATEPPLFVAGQMMSPREFIFGIFAAGLVGIAAYAIIGYFTAPLVGKAIALLPTQYLYPVIFMISLAASYSSRASIWDVGFAILFGVIGYGMRRTNFSAAAFIIAFVLTSSMEEAFRQSMIISNSGLMVFFKFEYMGKFSYAPIFLIIGALVVGFRAYSTISHKKKPTIQS
jgi:putative tricarboxylic transport membrane protein